MNFIKKAIDGKSDEITHVQFQKFSKGTFKDRAVLKVKKAKNKYTINTSGEYINGLVEVMAKKLGPNKTKVTGAVISTSDLEGKLDFKEKKQFQGVKRYLIDTEMSGDDIMVIISEFSSAICALSFDVGENKLKIKPKAPKMGVPGKGEELPKTDACKLITTDVALGESFIFEKKDFKVAEVNHVFLIEEIKIPETEEKDFAKLRALAIRSGKIIRTAKIDGEVIEKEYPFSA